MRLARHIIILKVWTIIPSNLKQRAISTEELSCFRQVLMVANTGSYGKCINFGLATEAMNGFVRSIQGPSAWNRECEQKVPGRREKGILFSWGWDALIGWE
jgi:hypothetical protein